MQSSTWRSRADRTVAQFRRRALATIAGETATAQANAMAATRADETRSLPRSSEIRSRAETPYSRATTSKACSSRCRALWRHRVTAAPFPLA